MSPFTPLFLWSGPRNISTALMYAFAQRTDTEVVDEPIYAHYLRVSGAEHPGRAKILTSQDQDGNQVMQDLLDNQSSKPVLFAKHMAHHLVDIDLHALKQGVNLLLIRHPAEVLNSFSKVIPNPILRDIGIRRQAELYEWLETHHKAPIVIDGNEVLKDPARELTRLCAAIGIPFEEEMTRWDAGPRPEDGIWAKYWYANVHASTGFQPYQAKSRKVAPRLQPVLEEALPHYDFLFSRSIHQ